MQRTEFRSARSVDRLINTLDPASMCGILVTLAYFVASFALSAASLPAFSYFRLPNPLERQIYTDDPLEALSIGVIAYRWKATRSPSSEILSWLLTRGELVLS